MSHEKVNTDSRLKSADEELLAEGGSEGGERSAIDTPPDSTSATVSPVHQAKSTKIDVLLKPAGDAPILKKKKWAVDKSKTIGWISEFIKRYIKSVNTESIFLYVNQSFSPSPDTNIGNVYDCFGSDGKLVLHYCRTQAWG